MNSLGPLETMNPNILSRQSNSKLQAAEQPTSPTPLPFDRNRSEATVPKTATSSTGGLSPVTRPSLTGMPSFQRPRKRVIWRNKACFIALPLEDALGRSTGKESYLSASDFERRLEDWKTQGLDTNGFTLAQQNPDSYSPISEGQSRAVHPDPEDEKRERADGTYRVNIPDQRRWEAYVHRRKENKLRALGVDEQIPRKSPAPSVMSRQGSSQSSNVLTSPALASSWPLSPCPPSFYGAAKASSYVGMPGIAQYSMAHPFHEPCLLSPRQLSQPFEPQILGTLSPQIYSVSQEGSRVASPQVNEHPQAFRHAAPSLSPIGTSNVGQVSNQASTGLLARTREQQALLQIQQLKPQQQYHLHPQPVLQQYSLHSPSISPNGDPTLQPVAHCDHLEIVSTVPRKYRQNQKGILQKGVDEAEAGVPYSMDGREWQKCCMATQIDEWHDEHQAINKSSNDGRASPQRARNLDLHARGFGDPVISQPGQSQSTSSSKASQFNVNAPKFEPGNLRNSGAFSFLGNHQAHKKAESESLNLPNPDVAVQAPDGTSQPSKWNVAAPEFMPKAPGTATIPSREFSFSALRPSLRPDAPAFEPSDSRSETNHQPTSDHDTVQPAKKIFGDIHFSGVIKPPKSKAIPVIQPTKEPNTHLRSDENLDGQEDESGRITQVDGRQKRMRLERDDGDQVPVFAWPEGIQPWMDGGGEDRAVYFSREPSAGRDALDATTLDAATDLLDGLIDDLSTTEASDLMREEESIDEDHKTGEEYVFNDLKEAASFNTARPPDPHEVARATRDFLGKSPEFATAFNRALRRRSSSSGSSRSSNQDEKQRCEHTYLKEIQDSVDCVDHVGQGTHPKIVNGVRHIEPSDNELDAIMKHLNRDESDLGVERLPSPWRSRSPSTSPVQYSSPKLHDSSTPQQLPPPAKIRSHASSPSPTRLQENYQYLPPTDSESANPSLVEMVARSARYSPSYRPSKNSPPIKPLNSPGSTPPSDWNDATSSLDEGKFHTETTKNRVSEVMKGVVQRELKPLEQALVGIQQSLAQLSDRPASRRSRSSGALEIEIEHSDADDEDDAEQVSQSRLKSPFRDRNLEQLKASVSKIAAAQQSFEPASQLAEMMAAVKDLKATIQINTSPSQSSGDLKNIVEEAVGRQMRGRSAPVTSSSQAAAAERSQLQIAGLESMLKIADARANDELQARRSVEDELAGNTRSLRIALQEASEHRESAEATERSLRDFHTERQQSLQRNAMLESLKDGMQKSALDLSEKNSALEETLAEYRLSSDQWRSEISDVKHENKDLKRIITSLNSETEAKVQIRQALQAKVANLQGEIATASRNVASDHIRWLSKEEEYQARLEILSARMEAEAGTRKRLKLEVERIEAQERETTKISSMAEELQKANAHSESLLAALRSECHDHQSVIARLRQQIDLDTTDADRFRSRHELMLEEASNSRSVALGEAARLHERSIIELKAQHERVLNNAFEDKQRSETDLGNKLSLANERLVHYQDKFGHLEEKLEIAKSAAYAAVQAAQSKKAVLTPSSPRTSPSLTDASNRRPLPEKVSPQALRESILVLQEQLQERETRIEQLENRLSSVDTNAPERLKNAEIEITWLRELIEIRVEDLDDLIATISQSFYNPDSVKDAAIRLKANLQMERQEKGRTLASFPSLARISNIAASPKAVPLAAAAAWGNWRKGRDSVFANQTPSKSSPQSLFAGLMTPPNTELRTSPPFGDSGMCRSSSNWPVKATTKPNESLPRQEERDSSLRSQPQQDPVTPPLLRKGSYDLDATESTAFGDEAIESTKTVGEDEPFGPNLGVLDGRM